MVVNWLSDANSGELITTNLTNYGPGLRSEVH
jgi:hypothetical protein